MFYLMTHSAHFNYGYMASDLWQRTTQILATVILCQIYLAWNHSDSEGGYHYMGY